MVFRDVTDGVASRLEAIGDGVAGLFEPTIRLGVTGLSRAGKTVFITSLVANLLDRGRMPQFLAASEGRILSAYLQPQPDDTVPRFDYETHLAALTGDATHWPESTRKISQLRLSLRVAPHGLLGGVTGPRVVHLDIVDYPGEWLLDLPLMHQSFEDWSAAEFAAAQKTPRDALAGGWQAALASVSPTEHFEEARAQVLARAYRAYLRAGRDAGLAALAPGRFMLPGELEGSPALTFCPLPPQERAKSGTLYAEFSRRFDAYKRHVVRPFFRDHFAKIDRQIVLMDVLSAVHQGPQALEDLRRAMAGILACFRPGQNSWLSALLGRRIDRVLFAATMADRLHHSQHPRLAGIAEALLRDAKDRAEYRGADVQAMAIAALRATVEQDVKHEGETLGMVRGRLESGKEAAMYAGDLPEDPARLLTPARQGAAQWLRQDFAAMKFLPPHLSRRAGDGLPHIRLDKAVEYLIGDRL